MPWTMLVALSLLSAADLRRAQPDEIAALMQHVRTIMKADRYSFLVTLDETGAPRARIMGAFEPDEAMTIWMATNPRTRKVADLRRDARAMMAYYDSKGGGYVTLSGRAEVVTDLAERRRRWTPEFACFFPGGPEGHDYVLLRFTPSRIEAMSFSLGVATRPFEYAPAVIVRSGSGWRREPGGS
jgi:general stress protein 26